MKTFASAVVVASLSGSVAFAGPDWLERGDAGSTIGQAQTIVGEGNLFSISGSLNEGVGFPDFEDMYLIRITEPAEFRFKLEDSGFDGSLWLFNITRANEVFGLLGNQDSGVEDFRPLLTSAADDGSGARVNNPGVYALVISAGGRRPVSDSGNIFAFESRTELSGPDGPGGTNPHTGWAGEGAAGGYNISVVGATFVEVPAPGAAALGLMAIAGFSSRRRRA